MNNKTNTAQFFNDCVSNSKAIKQATEYILFCLTNKLEVNNIKSLNAFFAKVGA